MPDLVTASDIRLLTMNEQDRSSDSLTPHITNHSRHLSHKGKNVCPDHAQFVRLRVVDAFAVARLSASSDGRQVASRLAFRPDRRASQAQRRILGKSSRDEGAGMSMGPRRLIALLCRRSTSPSTKTRVARFYASLSHSLQTLESPSSEPRTPPATPTWLRRSRGCSTWARQ